MDLTTIIGVNLPMVILNALANLFFIFCLVRPFQGETLKQPLKLLLWTTICSTLSSLASLLVLFYLVMRQESFVAQSSIFVMFLFSFSISMGTSVWLNFFYCMQIVPSKNAVFIWIKKNLKPIIYCIWVFEKLINGLTVSSILIFNISVFNIVSDLDLSNSTNTSYIILPSNLFNYRLPGFVTFSFLIICVGIMSVSSWFTAIYLTRHMCRMASQGLFCSRFHSQVRVTVTGIMQGALYALLSGWILSDKLFVDILAKNGPLLHFSNVTIINVYMMGTSVNLGVGQAVFRQGAVDLLHRAVHCCSTRRQQQSQQGGS